MSKLVPQMTYTTVEEWYTHLKHQVESLKLSVEGHAKELIATARAKSPSSTPSQFQRTEMVFRQVEKRFEEVVYAMEQCRAAIERLEH